MLPLVRFKRKTNKEKRLILKFTGKVLIPLVTLVFIFVYFLLGLNTKSIIEDARMMFKIRSKMVDVKWNFKNDARYKAELWFCDGCKGAIETQSHVMHCPAYENLRVGMSPQSDKDIVEYFRKVLQIRLKVH